MFSGQVLEMDKHTDKLLCTDYRGTVYYNNPYDRRELCRLLLEEPYTEGIGYTPDYGNHQATFLYRYNKKVASHGQREAEYLVLSHGGLHWGYK